MKKLVSKSCKTFRILIWLLLIMFQAYFLTILPRVGFSFGHTKNTDSGQSQFMHNHSEGTFFVTVDNYYCFKILSLRRWAQGPRFATSCFGSGQSPCFCCWPKEKPPLRMRLTCWALCRALSYVLNKFLVWIRQGVEDTVFRELKKHIENVLD